MEQVSTGNKLLDTLNYGTKPRASSSTELNTDSSRSHMIATMLLSLTTKRTGKVLLAKLALVDLASLEIFGNS